MIYAVDSCAAFGESKRSAKKDPNCITDYKIYSLSYMNDLRTTAKEIGKYVKTNYPQIKMVRDITPEILQSYIDTKRECSVQTVRRDISHIVKLEKCMVHKYGTVQWHTKQLVLPQTVRQEKVRDLVMAEGDYKKLLERMKLMRGGAWKALVLGWCAGLRVNEAREVSFGCLHDTGGRFGCGRITLNGKADGCKGGRARTVDILSLDDLTALREVVRGVEKGEQIVTHDGKPYAKGSILAAMRTAAKDIDIEEKKWNRLHAARKAFAQRSYDMLRETGAPVKECQDYANRQLGHGRNRKDLVRAYEIKSW